MNKHKLQAILREIQADMAADAKAFDGRPFDGRTVAEYFGNQGAAIAAVAKILEQVLESPGLLDAVDPVGEKVTG